jgi:hypothetical protein
MPLLVGYHCSSVDFLREDKKCTAVLNIEFQVCMETTVVW